MAAGASAIVGVRYPRARAFGVLNEATECEHKVWIYDNGLLAWELRRALVPIFAERKELCLNKLLKPSNHGDDLTLCFQRLGCDDGIIPNRRCAMANGFVVTSVVREEYSCPTKSYIALLLHFSSRSHSAKRRDVSLSVLSGLLQRCAQTDVVDRRSVKVLFATFGAQCTVAVAGNARPFCCHLRHIEDFSDAEALLGQHGDFARLLVEMYSQTAHCSACCNMLAFLVNAMARRIDEYTAIADLPSDPAQAETPMGACKRLRVDEDWLGENIVSL